MKGERAARRRLPLQPPPAVTGGGARARSRVRRRGAPASPGRPGPRPRAQRRALRSRCAHELRLASIEDSAVTAAARVRPLTARRCPGFSPVESAPAERPLEAAVAKSPALCCRCLHVCDQPRLGHIKVLRAHD